MTISGDRAAVATFARQPLQPKRQVHIDSAAGAIRVVADQVIPPFTVPADTEKVKRHQDSRASLLSKFWGGTIYLGAVVLLPPDYDRTTIRYPIDYIQGHFFAGSAPIVSTVRNEFPQELWMSDHFRA